MNQFDYGIGVCKELEAACPGDKILKSLVFIACQRKTNGKEQFVLQKSEGATELWRVKIFNYLPH